MFYDRRNAGQQLAKSLEQYANAQDTIVIALPRGGVVIGYAVATHLHLPLDIMCPRKIGAPFSSELAIGAITETGEGILSEDIIQELGVSPDFIERSIAQEKKEAASRLNRYRRGRPRRNLQNKRVILVDDGLATGATMRAAIKTARAEKAREIIMAVPVAPPDTIYKLKKEVDQIVCLFSPTPFYAVGQFYQVFDQTSDEEVIELLDKALKDQSNISPGA